MSSGVFTAVTAGAVLLTLAGLMQLDHFLILFLVGGVGKKVANID